MPWQGQKDNLIDRFDVRAHLDYIPSVTSKPDQPVEDDVLDMEERSMNYERFRVLAQNEFLGISEDKYLHQLYLEEQFGVNAQVEAEQKSSSSKKKASSGGVAIGYTYEESEPSGVVPFTQTISAIEQSSATTKYDECMKSDSDSDLDMDVSIDINKVGNAQAHEMNTCGRHYGMKSNDFYSFLTKDADEAEALKMAREEEQENIMFSGRKSRRERRAQRERKFAGRPLSPPSYAAKEELVPRTYDDPNDSSRSPSPVNSGKITYITSFGGEDELQPHSKISISFNKESLSKPGTSKAGSSTYAEKVKQNLEKLKSMSTKEEESKIPVQYQRRSKSGSDRSRSRSRSPRTWRRRKSRSRSKTKRTFSKYKRQSHSESRSSRSRSRSRGRKAGRRSPDYSSRRKKARSSSSSSSSSSPARKPSRKTSSSESVSSRSSRSRSRSKSKRVLPVAAKPQIKTELAVAEQIPKRKSPSPPSSLPSELSAASKKVEPSKVPTFVEPEPEVPIRRYYGRKRDGQSSSDTDLSTDSSDEEPQKRSGDPVMESSTNVQKADQPSGLPPGLVTIKQERMEPGPSGTSSHLSSSTTSSRFGKSSVTSTGGSTISTSESKSSGSHSVGTSKAINPRDRLKRKMQILLNKQFKADKKAEIEKVERQIQQQQEREDEMRELALKLRRRQRELRHKYGTPESDKSPSQSNDNSSDGDPPKETRLPPVKEPTPPKKAPSPSIPSSTSSFSKSAVIERKPVLRRLAQVETPQAPLSTARSTRRRSWSHSRSRSPPSSSIGGRTFASSTGSKRRSPPPRPRRRSRSRSRERDRDRDRGRYSSKSSRDYERGESSRHYRRRSRSTSRDRRRSRSRTRRSRSKSRYTSGSNRRDRSPKVVKKLVDY
ncbi:CLK4-associating serine/arginine rich protein isoform X2 [Toxorhynchites rutilus septentrionalis]|nr:CLK4-associating serine/arginine rich protein isoform X2 [Toxorhynchites rutilus septentrionalis]